MENDLANFEGPLALFPLPQVVFLPHTVLPLHVFEPRYVRMVEDALKGLSLIGMVREEPAAGPGTLGDPPVRRVGCVGRIRDLRRLPGGRFNLNLSGLARFEIVTEVQRRPYRAARVRLLPDANDDDAGEPAEATLRLLLNLLSANTTARGETPQDEGYLGRPICFGAKVNLLAATSRLTPDEAQALLESHDVRQRARLLEGYLRTRIDARSWAECWRALSPADPAQN